MQPKIGRYIYKICVITPDSSLGITIYMYTIHGSLPRHTSGSRPFNWLPVGRILKPGRNNLNRPNRLPDKKSSTPVAICALEISSNKHPDSL